MSPQRCGAPEEVAELRLLGRAVAAPGGRDADLDLEHDRAHRRAARVDGQREAQRRRGGVRQRLAAEHGEAQLGRVARHDGGCGAHGGGRFGIRGSIGPCFFGLMPVDAAAVRRPSGRCPACFS